jgi:hypothetical protein
MHFSTYVLPSVTEINDLDVVIDSKPFTSHIYRVVAQASVRANLIEKYFIFKDVSTLIYLFRHHNIIQ